MRIVQALDELFVDIKFDKDLIDRLARVNLDFITSNKDIQDMMGSKYIGCHHFSYTHYHKKIFYEQAFDLDYDDVRSAIAKITSIPKNFKVARDDINLVCFYVLHKFMNNKQLSKRDQERGATEILNYFGYRTLVTITSAYWVYPMDYDKAVTLSESLSGNFLITELKNWNAYVQHRTETYLKGNYVKSVISMRRDEDIPNAINDLYNRYKDTIKKIWSEFARLEDENIIRSNRNVVTDLEGRDVLLDRMNDSRVYIDRVLDSLTAKDQFIRRDAIEVSSSIVTAISQEQLTECLELVMDYYYTRGKRYSEEVTNFIEAFITNTLEYLQSRRMYINNKSNLVEVVNVVVGNILYSRGAGISITKVKDDGEKLIKNVYRKGKVTISNRNLAGMRNIFCVYILILSLM